MPLGKVRIAGSAIGVGFRFEQRNRLDGGGGFFRRRVPESFPPVEGIRGVHSGRIAFEVLSHPRNLLRQFFQVFFITTWRRC
jgi:hypothetical protein